MFPNPIRDKVILIIDSKTRGTRISVSSINGNLLIHENIEASNENERIKFNLAGKLKRGIYVMKVSGSGWTEVFKIIKE